MNNSTITKYNAEEVENNKLDILQKEQGKLAQIVEAVGGVEASNDWQKLKRLVLDDVAETIERQLRAEMERKEINAPEVYRLQGQLAWARRYLDLKKLADFFKQQLVNINNQIKHEKNPRDGTL